MRLRQIILYTYKVVKLKNNLQHTKKDAGITAYLGAIRIRGCCLYHFSKMTVHNWQMA